MSKYYDPNRPFSLEQWNMLVDDVNNILQNPVGNCQPVSPCSRVVDPHRWSVADIEEVRNKLKETCPEIDFTVTLDLWKQAILDEIEQEMEKAWCDCEDSAYICEEASLGPYHPEEVLAGADHVSCCGNVIEGTIESPLCPGRHYQETLWDGEWYPPVDNEHHRITVYDTGSPADTASYRIGLNMSRMQDAIEDIERHQAVCDEATQQAEHYLTLYRQTGEEEHKWQVCNYHGMAKSAQFRVDEAHGRFQEYRTLMLDAVEEVNTLAAQNWSAALAMEGRYPPDRNVLTEIADILPTGGWWSKVDLTRDYYTTEGRTTPRPETDNKFYEPKAVIRYRASNAPYISRPYFEKVVRFAPDGTPYLKDRHADEHVLDLSKVWYRLKHRYRAQTQSQADDWGIDLCEFPDWRQIEWDVRYENTLGTTKEYWDGATGTWEIDITICQMDRGQADNTAKNEAYLNRYENWYDDHPPYDNRYDGYC